MALSHQYPEQSVLYILIEINFCGETVICGFQEMLVHILSCFPFLNYCGFQNIKRIKKMLCIVNIPKSIIIERVYL